jgi:disulfide bond formation protein DsbB
MPGAAASGIRPLAGATPTPYIECMIQAIVQRFPWLLLAASLGSLASALAFQHLGGFEPCILCLYQRWPYVAVAALAALALALPRPRWVRPALLVLCALALLIGGGIAVFHVGVEQHWWAGTAACEGQLSIGRGSIEDLRAQLLDSPVARCDQVPWSLFGISMAGYNAMISFGLGALSLFAAWRLARDRSA